MGLLQTFLVAAVLGFLHLLGCADCQNTTTTSSILMVYHGESHRNIFKMWQGTEAAEDFSPLGHTLPVATYINSGHNFRSPLIDELSDLTIKEVIVEVINGVGGEVFSESLYPASLADKDHIFIDSNLPNPNETIFFSEDLMMVHQKWQKDDVFLVVFATQPILLESHMDAVTRLAKGGTSIRVSNSLDPGETPITGVSSGSKLFAYVITISPFAASGCGRFTLNYVGCFKLADVTESAVKHIMVSNVFECERYCVSWSVHAIGVFTQLDFNMVEQHVCVCLNDYPLISTTGNVCNVTCVHNGRGCGGVPDSTLTLVSVYDLATIYTQINNSVSIEYSDFISEQFNDSELVELPEVLFIYKIAVTRPTTAGFFTYTLHYSDDTCSSTKGADFRHYGEMGNNNDTLYIKVFDTDKSTTIEPTPIRCFYIVTTSEQATSNVVTLGFATGSFVSPKTMVIRAVWEEDCGAWTTWSSCSESCDAGTQVRTRVCSGHIHEDETQACMITACSVCDYWSPWSNCSVTCGSGDQTRTRNCLGQSETEFQPCSMNACPVCNQWQAWTACSATCDTGYQERTRVCPNDTQTESQTCSGPACQVCNQWESWTACSATCDTGYQERTRVCPNDTQTESQTCSGPACQVCNQWQAWTACSATCDTGYQERTRVCPNDTQTESQTCDGPACQVCNQWQAWTACSATCDTGYQERTRVCPNDTQTESQTCDGPACQVCNEWQAWTACSATCDTGYQERTRVCPNDTQTESQTCSGQACQVCHQWEAWTACSATCDTGYQERTRVCPNDTQTESQTCDGPACQVCNQWQAWTACSATCDTGYQERTRVCPNDTQTESQTCSGPPCQVCHQWQAWTACSATCDTGYQERTRVCPNDTQTESQTCSGPACQVCNQWEAWTACSATCDTGYQERTRVCPNDTQTESQMCSNQVCHANITTTANPTTTTAASGNSTTLTEEELNSKVEEIIRTLTVPKTNTSRMIRKLSCAEDNRTSAVAIGAVGVVSLTLTAGLFVLMDATSIMQAVMFIKGLF